MPGNTCYNVNFLSMIAGMEFWVSDISVSSLFKILNNIYVLVKVMIHDQRSHTPFISLSDEVVKYR